MNLLILSLVALPLPAPGQGPSPVEAALAEPVATAEHFGPLRVDRGTGQLALVVPRAEELRFRVRLGSNGANVGTAVFRSEVSAFDPATRRDPASSEEQGGESAVLSIDIEVDYSSYSIDATLETRFLPQEWPRIFNRYVRVGEKPRRREILIGLRGGRPTACYRKDTDDGAPMGTRIWREDRYRDIPQGVLDTVGAIHVARTLVTEGLPATRFPAIDRLQLWRMEARRGKEKRVKTPAGTFDAVEVELEASPWPGEERDEDGDRVSFKGLFGMEGAIRVWIDRRTGVPVRIDGELPVGFFDIDLVLELESHQGTPPAFRAIDARAGG